ALCQLTMPPVCYLRCLAPHHELHSFPTRRSSDLCSEENDSATSSSSKGCSRRPPGRTRTPLRRTASPRGRLNGSSPPERSTRVSERGGACTRPEARASERSTAPSPSGATSGVRPSGGVRFPASTVGRSPTAFCRSCREGGEGAIALPAEQPGSEARGAAPSFADGARGDAQRRAGEAPVVGGAHGGGQRGDVDSLRVGELEQGG